MALTRRTPLRAKTGLRARTPLRAKTGFKTRGSELRQVSDKRAGQLVEYRRAVAAVDARDRGVCAARRWGAIAGPCGMRPDRQAIEHDHMDGRRGERLVRIEDIQSLCPAHRDWVGSNIWQARAIGLRRYLAR